MQVIAERILKPWCLFEPLFRWSKLGEMQRQAEKVINAYAEKVIRAKREEIRARKQQDGEVAAHEAGDDGALGVRKKFTFLELVLGQDEDLLTDEEILQEVGTAASCGHLAPLPRPGPDSDLHE